MSKPGNGKPKANAPVDEKKSLAKIAKGNEEMTFDAMALVLKNSLPVIHNTIGVKKTGSSKPAENMVLTAKNLDFAIEYMNTFMTSNEMIIVGAHLTFYQYDSSKMKGEFLKEFIRGTKFTWAHNKMTEYAGSKGVMRLGKALRLMVFPIIVKTVEPVDWMVQKCAIMGRGDKVTNPIALVPDYLKFMNYYSNLKQNDQMYVKPPFLQQIGTALIYEVYKYWKGAGKKQAFVMSTLVKDQYLKGTISAALALAKFGPERITELLSIACAGCDKLIAVSDNSYFKSLEADKTIYGMPKKIGVVAVPEEARDETDTL